MFTKGQTPGSQGIALISLFVSQNISLSQMLCLLRLSMWVNWSAHKLNTCTRLHGWPVTELDCEPGILGLGLCSCPIYCCHFFFPVRAMRVVILLREEAIWEDQTALAEVRSISALFHFKNKPSLLSKPVWVRLFLLLAARSILPDQLVPGNYSYKPQTLICWFGRAERETAGLWRSLYLWAGVC